ncbi:MAG: ABC transporter substrate-binding protein [Proteobacteria bacterium]|nr:ABC transporter substrate-binding protein [Pseudomonadota bacterium]
MRYYHCVVWAAIILALISQVSPTDLLAKQQPSSADHSHILLAQADSQLARKRRDFAVRISHWPSSFNPLNNPNTTTLFLSSLTQGSLLILDQETGKFRPYLAKGFSYNSSHTSLTFTLRTEPRFSPKHQLNAEDVVSTFRHIKDNPNFALGTSKVKKITIISPHKVRFHFTYPSRFHHHTIGQIPIIQKQLPNEEPYSWLEGLGPYKITNISPGKHITLMKKDDQWWSNLDHIQPRFKVKKITAIYIKQNKLALQAFLNQQLSTLYFNESLSADWHEWQRKKLPNLSFHSYLQRSLATQRFILWNLKNSLMKDPKVREALYHLLPEKWLKDQPLANDFLFMSQPFLNAFPLARPKRSMEAAKKLLEDHTKLREPQDNKGTKENTITINYSDFAQETWLLEWQKNAKQVGLDLALNYVALEELLPLVDSQLSHGTLMSFTQISSAMTYNFWHSQGQGFAAMSGLKEPKIDSLLQKLMVTENSMIKNQLEKQVAAKIFSSHAAVYLWQKKHHYIAYWSHHVSAAPTIVYPYAGSDILLPYYLHWQLKSSNEAARK